MNYIERVQGRIYQLRGKTVSMEDIVNCFDESDIIIEKIERGIFNVYSKKRINGRGILQVIFKENKLYDVNVYDYEEDCY